MIYFIDICILIAVGFVVFQLFKMNLLRNMKAKNKALKESNVLPYGSGLVHGMVYNKENKSLIKDSKPSPAWFERLSS